MFTASKEFWNVFKSTNGALSTAEAICIMNIAAHDYKNQFTEVEGAYDYLVGTGKYEPIHINWQEIFDYVAEHNLEEGNNSWHLYPELPHPPNFVGALRRK